MPRKVTVEVKVKLEILLNDDNLEVSHVIQEMDYTFDYNEPGATIMDTEIIDQEEMNTELT